MSSRELLDETTILYPIEQSSSAWSCPTSTLYCWMKLPYWLLYPGCSRVECSMNCSLKWVVYWYISTTLCFVVPVRGHALISLRRLLEDRDPEALEKQEVLLKVFQENIDHADTYIYLAAIQVRLVPGKYWPNWYNIDQTDTILTKLIRTSTSQPFRWGLFQENIDQTDTYFYLATIGCTFLAAWMYQQAAIQVPKWRLVNTFE